MPRKLDIGIASYGAPEKLKRTLASLRDFSTTDWRAFVVDNPHGNSEIAARTRELIANFAAHESRIVPVSLSENVGYAGAVNKLLDLAETEYIAYCDNDIEIRTPGWDEKLISVMERNTEVGWIFPGAGHYGFFNGKYHECLWNAGYCWVLRHATAWRMAQQRPASNGVGGFDLTLGHHEEVDYMIRMRLDGWRIGCRPDVNVFHHESATRQAEADHKPGGRIHDGVVRWMNKWNQYFCGDDLKYSMTAYDPCALRYTDWNVDALYLERFTLHHFPELNAHPETVMVPGVGAMDVIKVLKPKGCYVGRAI